MRQRKKERKRSQVDWISGVYSGESNAGEKREEIGNEKE